MNNNTQTEDTTLAFARKLLSKIFPDYSNDWDVSVDSLGITYIKNCKESNKKNLFMFTNKT